MSLSLWITGHKANRWCTNHHTPHYDNQITRTAPEIKSSNTMILQHKSIAGNLTVIQSVSQFEGVDGQISITTLASLSPCSV